VPIAALAGGTPATPVIFALDLGQRTGWAVRNRDGAIASGVHEFRPGRFEGGGMIWLRFRAWLQEVDERRAVVSWFEVVGISTGHMYGGYLAHSPLGQRTDPLQGASAHQAASPAGQRRQAHRASAGSASDDNEADAWRCALGVAQGVRDERLESALEKRDGWDIVIAAVSPRGSPRAQADEPAQALRRVHRGGGVRRWLGGGRSGWLNPWRSASDERTRARTRSSEKRSCAGATDGRYHPTTRPKPRWRGPQPLVGRPSDERRHAAATRPGVIEHRESVYGRRRRASPPSPRGGRWCSDS
jgi:hypothetical protein